MTTSDAWFRPRTAIIGAGPGGLTRARIPRRHGIPVAVYERDPAPGVNSVPKHVEIH
jgi:flavin-dependent dehydrogenase